MIRVPYCDKLEFGYSAKLILISWVLLTSHTELQAYQLTSSIQNTLAFPCDKIVKSPKRDPMTKYFCRCGGFKFSSRPTLVNTFKAVFFTFSIIRLLSDFQRTKQRHLPVFSGILTRVHSSDPGPLYYHLSHNPWPRRYHPTISGAA